MKIGPARFGDAKVLTKLMRHPKLMLNALRGEQALAKMHVRIELEKAREIFSSQLDKGLLQPNERSWERIARIFHREICYHVAPLYALCRLFRPETIVETGVLYGVSSAFILQALSDNNKGQLYSIDLPNLSYTLDNGRKHSDLLPAFASPGFVVPDSLRHRWTLILGNAKKELPRLVRTLDSIDIFHHDSLHTYEHMMFEYETAWAKIPKNGILSSDDVHWSNSFGDFVYAHAGFLSRPVVVHNLGVVRRTNNSV
jgi:hypothetical protein